MTLTAKEITTLELLNKKGLVYEYVEVEALGLGGVTKLVNKLVKINAKAKKVNPVMEMCRLNPEISDARIEEMRLESFKKQSINL